MEFNNVEGEAIAAKILEAEDIGAQDLAALRLAIGGGGMAQTVIG